MKTKFSHAGTWLTLAGGLALVSGCVVEPNGTVGFQPLIIAPAPVVVAPPPPYVEPAPPEVEVQVPDAYVWDGYESVGLVGGAYFYLGPGNVWLACGPDRLGRFHDWERVHPDWRDHAIRNDRFRTDAHGRVAPMRDDHQRKSAPKPKKEEQH